ENNRGGNDYWAIKLDANGNKQWDKTIGGNAEDYVNSVAQTADGGYALLGASISNKSGDKKENSQGGFDYWLVKLSKDGNLRGQKTIGGISDDYGQTIENTADGGVILGGQSASPISSDKDENTMGGFDYWLVKINSDGAIAWNKDIGSDGDDNLRTVKESSPGKYVIGGFTWGGASGDKTDIDRGGTDYWIITMRDGSATASSEATNPIDVQNNAVQKSLSNNSFSVYPNPAKTTVTIKLSGKAVFTLTDQSGRIVATKTIDSNGTIDVSAFPSGLYFIRNKTTGAMQKLIVSK
ncbi:MAG: T9SS type A sorting domain-containing protein, partial [Parafilimonas sp.]